MYLFQRRFIRGYLQYYKSYGKKINVQNTVRYQTTGSIEESTKNVINRTSPFSEISTTDPIERDILNSARILPLNAGGKETTVLSFDEIPGPKAFKYLSICRYYLHEFGTQITAGILTMVLNMSAYINKNKSTRKLSNLFDEYGPVVKFVNPVGADIVLLNHPAHIQRVFSLEGDFPVRSALESLQKYRSECRGHGYGGLYADHGEEWSRRRTVLDSPTNMVIFKQTQNLLELCDKFCQRIYNIKNYQDEVINLQEEVQKWTFDTMGLVMFAQKFSMLETDIVHSQCDMSWMYYSLIKATEAIMKCESGMHMWKLFITPAWYNLRKHCDSLDSLIGKFVMGIEKSLSKENYGKRFNAIIELDSSSVTSAILLSDQNFETTDIATIIMDMLLIGVNTVSSSMSFLLYHLAKHQRVQKKLYTEIENLYRDKVDISTIKDQTPYLQACIQETLRLVPPIPLLTRILPRNIILDRYNIPRGTVIIMSTQEAALRETNFDDAAKYDPDRWLRSNSDGYHAFASIPFGYGIRKCLGQNIAETMISLLTIRVLHRYKLEYHYGDVHPTKQFISRPNKPLKIRFIDRM